MIPWKKKPFTDADINILEDFLLSGACGADVMAIDEVHGMLTALACSPEPVPESEWLPIIYGGQAIFRDERQAEEMYTLLQRLKNEITRTLRDGEGFSPLILEYRQDDGRVCPLAEGWCNGFMRGVGLRPALWNEGEEAKEILFPVIALSEAFAGSEEAKGLLSDPVTVDRLCNMIPDAVEAIYELWAPCRNNGGQLAAADGDDGYFEYDVLCPCGSGKSYKKCCGSPSRLH